MNEAFNPQLAEVYERFSQTLWEREIAKDKALRNYLPQLLGQLGSKDGLPSIGELRVKGSMDVSDAE